MALIEPPYHLRLLSIPYLGGIVENRKLGNSHDCEEKKDDHIELQLAEVDGQAWTNLLFDEGQPPRGLAES